MDGSASSIVGAAEQADSAGDLGTVLGSAVASGSTLGMSNGHQPSCASSEAPEATYTWTAPSDGSYIFTTFGSGFDTVLEIRTSTQILGCNDDSNRTTQSTVNVPLWAGQTVEIVIDGYGSAAGSYELNIARIPTSGLHMWLRGDAGINLTSRMNIWVDQSGNQRDGVMNDTSRQPFYISGALNGWPVARFTGAETMSFAINPTPTTFSIFIVGINSNQTESEGIILGPSGNSPNNQLRWQNGTSALFVGTSNHMPILTAEIGDTRSYHILSLRYDGSTMTVARAGTVVSSFAFSVTGPWTFGSLGSFYASDFLKGDIAEILIYERPLADDEGQSVIDYLGAKYSLPPTSSQAPPVIRGFPRPSCNPCVLSPIGCLLFCGFEPG